MNAKQRFDNGDLTGALETITQEIKANPNDAVRRTFLFELLCFAGELDRAQKQLDVVAHQDMQSEWGAQVYGNILEAERARRRLYSDGRQPEFLLDPPDWVNFHLQAVNCLRDNRPEEAAELLDQSLETRRDLAGQADGQAFDEFRDCDDLLGPLLELYILRDYVWLPLEQVRELEVSAPERPRDLLWIPVRVTLADDTQRRGYMPTLYHGSYQHPDDRIKLGRMTDWKSYEGGAVLGLGQRLFLIGEQDRGVLELRNASFQA